ncbi:hypothetical protein MP228_006729 [Amoeboaphelidium protococcarum]|nr:hypothetical protein MP228_006729 [Amoeboaphelidium protococcarum]
MSKINASELIVSAQNPDPSQHLTMLTKIGEGSYGSVYKVLHKATSTLAALKIVPVDQENGETIEDLMKEIEVMRGLDSRGIVKLFGSWFLEEKLWMLIEYCAAGSVSDIMKVCKCTMTEQEIACIMKQVMEGLAYLHERKKIHRDIKAGNILINDKGEAKLADFGVAGQLSDSVAKRNTVIGTPFWMAPEIIMEVGYNTGADIWSIGITCIEMHDGKPPYHNIHPMRAIFIIPSKPPATLEKPQSVSAAFNKFIARCLTKSPDQRPTALELLKDPFIVNAPSVNSGALTEKVARAVELISQGKLSSDSDDEEAGDDNDDEDSNNDKSRKSSNVSDNMTMMSTKSGKSSAVDDGTVRSVTHDFNTMLVSGTMVQRDVSSGESSVQGTYKPAFMQMMNGKNGSDEVGATIKPVKQQQQLPAQNKKQGSENDLEYGTIKPKDQNQAKQHHSRHGLNSSKQDLASNPLAKPPSAEELNEMLKALETSMDKEISMIKTKYERKKEPIVEAMKTKRGGIQMQ